MSASSNHPHLTSSEVRKVNPKDQLIARWTSGLHDNAEQQLHAQGLLDEVIDENAPQSAELEVSLQRVTEKSRVLRRRALMIGTAVVLIGFALMLYQSQRLLQGFLEYRRLTGMSQPREVLVKTATPEESFLLYGDLKKIGKAEQRRALWQSDPKNPAFYADYARVHILEHRTLPVDFVKVGESIDPDNGWYALTAAEQLASGVAKAENNLHPKCTVTQSMLSKATNEEKKRLRARMVNAMTIIDLQKAGEVLDLWRSGLHRPRHDGYEITLHRLRHPILSRRTSWHDQFLPLGYLFEQVVLILQNRELTNVLVASLQQADFHTPEGKQLLADVMAYMKILCYQDCHILIDVLVRRVSLGLLAKQIEVLDTSAWDPHDVEVWQFLHESFLRASSEQGKDASSDLIEQHAAMLALNDLPHLIYRTKRQAPLSASDLTPLRLVDHSLILQVVSLIACLILILLIPYPWFLRGGGIVTRISDEAWQSLRPRDLMKMVFCCVMAPIAYYALLTWLTPWTGKEYGYRFVHLFPVVPAVSLFLLILVLCRCWADHATRAWRELASHGRKRKPYGLIVAALLLLPLHGTTLLAETYWSKVVQLSVVGVCLLPAVIWLTVRGWRGMFVRDFYEKVLHGLRRRMIGVATLSTIAFLLLITQLLVALESRWLQQDRTMNVDPDLPTLSYEAAVTRIAQDELRAMIEFRK